jgi:hypothetical protein
LTPILINLQGKGEKVMGLEKMIDLAIEEKAPDLVGTYHWSNGMVVDEPEYAQDLVEAIDATEDFGPARFNKETGKIEIGVTYEFYYDDEQYHKEEYFVYFSKFKSFEV